MKNKFQKKIQIKPSTSKLKQENKTKYKNIEVKAEEEAMNYEWRKHPGGG